MKRIDLLITLGVLALLVLVVLPALANQRPRSARILCANNLRQIGSAMQLWGNDHGDRPPFAVPTDEGGTLGHPLAVNAWLHFSSISNELASAQVLLCPSDTGRAARDFTFNPNGGYLHPNFGNRATSYFLSHSLSTLPTGEALAGDRNLGYESAAFCPNFNQVRAATRIGSTPFLKWTSGLHGDAGNLLRFDGRVDQLNTAGLRRALSEVHDNNGTLHFIVPR